LIFRLFTVLFLCAAGALGLAWYDYDRWLNKPVNLPQGESIFTIERGWSARQVSYKLLSDGVIDKVHWFDLYSRISEKAGEFKSGEFILEPELTPPELVDVFVAGQTRQYQHSVIEGDNWRQMRKRLAGKEDLLHTLSDDLDPSFMAELGMPDLHPEGQFFADTYQFPKGTNDIEFLKRAKKTLDKVLEEEWQNRAPDLPLETPYEALILASIVEKETAVPAERPLIAGVFMSRLKLGMRLQTDPTVIYGIGPSYDGNIRRKDLRTDTPYNTYTRAGLPPTPISMVGREAINAVLHPEDTSALYFVAKGDGTHKFSDNVDDHNAAVRKYQLKQ